MSIYIKKQLTIFCEFDFSLFPYDEQVCELVPFLYSLNTTQATLNRLDWDKKSYSQLDDSYRGYEIYGRSQDSESERQYFSQDLEITFDKNVDVIQPNTRHIFSGQRFVIRIKRDVSFYIRAYMLPAIFFVIISYTSFWVAKGAAPARVALCIIGVLITINFNNNLLTILPETTESVWLQNFTFTILIFTAFAIIEYAFVNFTTFNHSLMQKTVEDNIKDIMARLHFNFNKDYDIARKKNEALELSKQDNKRSALTFDPLSGETKTIQVNPPPTLQSNKQTSKVQQETLETEPNEYIQTQQPPGSASNYNPNPAVFGKKQVSFLPENKVQASKKTEEMDDFDMEVKSEISKSDELNELRNATDAGGVTKPIRVLDRAKSTGKPRSEGADLSLDDLGDESDPVSEQDSKLGEGIEQVIQQVGLEDKVEEKKSLGQMLKELKERKLRESQANQTTEKGVASASNPSKSVVSSQEAPSGGGLMSKLAKSFNFGGGAQGSDKANGKDLVSHLIKGAERKELNKFKENLN